MPPYGYKFSRMLSKYYTHSRDTKDFRRYLNSKLGDRYCDVLKYSVKDYRVKLRDVQSVDVNSKNFTGMLLVGDRGCGKDYTACGAILEFIHNNPNSVVALFDISLEHKMGDDGAYTSWILEVLSELLPPFLNFTLDEAASKLIFNNGAVLELHHVTSDLTKYIDKPPFDFLILNESLYQNGISQSTLSKISKLGWVAVGSYQDPLGDEFVSECMASGVDVRFSSYKDNHHLSQAYTTEMDKMFGVFGRMLANEKCTSQKDI